MVDKLLKIGNITEFEDKLKARLQRGRLQFGNRLQLAEIKVLSLIDDLKLDEDKFLSCKGCGDKISLLKLTKIDNCLYCDNCISDNYMNCHSCGDYIYNEDIQEVEGEIYCQECYFKEKQEIYHSHKIINPLIKKLSDVIEDYNLKEVEFKIEGHLWEVESYARGNFRLGSWGANSWVDIGNCEGDILKAIDYNLGVNRDKLTNIFLNNDTEVEL